MFACSKPANPPPNVCLACKAPDTSCHTSSDCCSNICGSDHFCHRAEWGGQCSNDNDCDRDPSTPVFNFTCHDNLCCKVAGLPCGLNSECCHGCNLGTHQCN